MQLSRIACCSSRPLANSLTSSPSPQSSPASPVSPRLARSPHFARLPQPPSSLCSVHSPTIPRLASPRLASPRRFLRLTSPRLPRLASLASPRFDHRLASHLLLAHAFLTSPRLPRLASLASLRLPAARLARFARCLVLTLLASSLNWFALPAAARCFNCLLACSACSPQSFRLLACCSFTSPRRLLLVRLDSPARAALPEEHGLACLVRGGLPIGKISSLPRLFSRIQRQRGTRLRRAPVQTTGFHLVGKRAKGDLYLIVSAGFVATLGRISGSFL
jgi:hypothetical protein